MQYAVHIEQEGPHYIATFMDSALTGVTQGETLAEALDMAEDMLLCNIEDFFDMDEAVPDAVARGDHYVRLPLLVRMKVLLHNEMLKQHISKAQLARLLDTTPQEIRRILRVRHNTQPAILEQALAALNTHVELAETA